MADVRNRWRGEVPFRLGGRDMLLVFDYAALARLRDEIGADFGEQLDAAANGIRVEVIAKVLAIGLAREQPDITDAMVFSESPPLLPAWSAIRRAMAYTFNGEGEAPEPPAARPPKRAGWLARLIPSRRRSAPQSAAA